MQSPTQTSDAYCAIDRIPLIGHAVHRFMHPKLEQQAKTSCYHAIDVDTMRLCRLVTDMDPEDMGKQLVFAAVEMSQNFFDFPDLSDAVPRQAPNGIEWWAEFGDGAEDELVAGIYFTETGVELLQPGGPLSIDACTSGTQSKNEDQGSAGGFGDGFKTSCQIFIRLGCQVVMIARNYQQYKPGFSASCLEQNEELVWRPVSEIAKGYTEPHLVVKVERHAQPEVPGWKMPTFTTYVSASADDSDKVHSIHVAFYVALSRFKRMYDVVPDELDRTIGDPTVGYLHHSDTFVPRVREIVPGVPLELSKDRMQVLVGGIFQPAESCAEGMPPTLIVEVPGKGIMHKPPHQYQIFSGPAREPKCDNVIMHVYTMAAHLFNKARTDPTTEKQLLDAFRPLLKGGSSLLHQGGKNVGSLLMRVLMYRHISEQVKHLLIYETLLPDDATQQQKEHARELAQKTVVVHKDMADRAKYLMLVEGKGNRIVSVDPRQANTQIFYPQSKEQLERHAAYGAVGLAQEGNGGNGGNAISVFACKHISKAGTFMSDFLPGIQFVRIRHAFPDHKPYDFMVDERIVVYYEPNGEGPHTIHNLYPFVSRVSDGAAIKSRDFFGHFVHGDQCKNLPLGKRVNLAIKLTKENEPFVVKQGPVKKKDLKDSSSDSDSDDDKVKKPKSKPPPTPVPKPKRPATSLTDSKKKEEEEVKTKKKMKVSLDSESEDDKPKARLQQKQDAKPKGDMRNTVSGIGATSTPRPHEPDPVPKECIQQEFVDQLGLFVPAGEKPEKTARMERKMGVFAKALEVLLASVDVGRCSVFASWSPGADWRGIHYGNGLCLVNIASRSVSELHTMIMIACHELAHEKTSTHDIRFSERLQENMAAVIAGYAKKAD